eukprot:3458677-Pleurochrysis_carterae.AAC.1
MLELKPSGYFLSASDDNDQESSCKIKRQKWPRCHLIRRTRSPRARRKAPLMNGVNLAFRLPYEKNIEMYGPFISICDLAVLVPGSVVLQKRFDDT